MKVPSLTDEQRKELQNAERPLKAAASHYVTVAIEHAEEPDDRTRANLDDVNTRHRRAALRYAAKRLEAAGRFPNAAALLLEIADRSEP